MQIIAHRGASGQYAEHTRAAYLRALADGADGVECDVHLSSDGQVVLMHDDTVDRTSDGTGPVAGKTLAELRALDISSWKGVALPDGYGAVADQLLTLAEILDLLRAAGRPVKLAIEFKYDVFTPGTRVDPALVDRTLAGLAAAGWVAATSTVDQVAVSFMSFHPDVVRRIAANLPARHVCQLIDDLPADSAGDPTGEYGRLFADALTVLDDGVAQLAGPGIGFLRAHTERARGWLAAGRRFRVWTVNTPEDLDFCRDLGVAEVTTDWPGRIRGLTAHA